MAPLQVRAATSDDIPQLLTYIRELAAHEGRPEAAVASEEGLQHWLFDKRAARVWMAEVEGQSVGYALCYPTFSTFQGACNLYLEDVYIRPDKRGSGYGQELMRILLRTAREGGYGALQWSCLDTNESGLAFYERLGARRKPHGTSFYIPL